MQFSEQVVMDAVPCQWFAFPPYRAEKLFCGAGCVINANDFNCLSFLSKPGAVLTTFENAVEIARRWNLAP